MKPHCCCGSGEKKPSAVAPPPAEPQHKPPLIRRIMNTIRWLLPGTLLFLIPKCPMCLAAYIALGTGIGLSITTARYLRIALIILCVASLAYLLFRRLRKIVKV